MGPARLGCGGAPGRAEPFSRGSCCLCSPPQSWQSWKKGDLKPLCALPRAAPACSGHIQPQGLKGQAWSSPFFGDRAHPCLVPAPFPALSTEASPLLGHGEGYTGGDGGSQEGMGVQGRRWGYTGG